MSKSNVVILSLKGTRIETWFLSALKEAREKGLKSSRAWLEVHVPKQFHDNLFNGVVRKISK